MIYSDDGKLPRTLSLALHTVASVSPGCRVDGARR